MRTGLHRPLLLKREPRSLPAFFADGLKRTTTGRFVGFFLALLEMFADQRFGLLCLLWIDNTDLNASRGHRQRWQRTCMTVLDVYGDTLVVQLRGNDVRLAHIHRPVHTCQVTRYM